MENYIRNRKNSPLCPVKKFFATNYEKLIFGIGVLILLAFILSAYSIDELNLNSIEERGGGGLVDSLRSEEGKVTLETKNPHELMPGEKIVIAEADPESFNGSFIVESVLMPKKNSDVRAVLKDGRTIKGRLAQIDAQKLDRDWRNASGGLRIDGLGDRQIIPFAQIERFAGSLTLTFSSLDVEEGKADGDIKLTTYQERASSAQAEELPSDSGVWSQTDVPPEGEPSYDLFTPPVIYVVNGRLATRLPEERKAEKPPEVFGARLVKFDKVPYRFRIRSWIGETPYLEDLLKEFPPGSGRYVRNRLKPRVPYKENTLYKPGAPTLIATNLDDADKLVMVEAFAVQDVRDPQAGGIRPVGRVLLKDFRLSGKAFEINSFMETTHAGQYQIAVESNLKEYAGEDFTFKENAKDTTFMLNEREYRILEIDANSTRVHIEKKALDPPEIQREWLSLSGGKASPSQN